MSKKVFIYALVDPRDNCPRYVGRTSNPEKRRAQHVSVAMRFMRGQIANPRPYHKWIASMVLIDNVFPELEVLEETNGRDALFREIAWIRHMAKQYELVNEVHNDKSSR